MKIGKSPLIAAGLAVLAAGWIASGQIGTGANGAEQASAPTDPKTEAPRATVRVADLTALPRMETVSITGRTQASRNVELRAETEGQIVELLAQRGDAVAKDAVIARLRQDDRGAKLSEAKAVLKQRQIEYDAAQKLHEKGFRSTTDQAGSIARLDAARAVVQQMQIDIARTTLQAPFDGIVREGHVELGDFVRVGDVAATIVDLDPVLAVGSVSERQIGGLQKGGTAQITLVDGSSHTGVIRFIAPVADPQTRTYRVELEIGNADYRIRDGITSEIRFPLGEELAHLVSPSVLTLNDAGVVGVRTVDENDIVRFKPVEILADETRGVWIGGLPNQVRLIVVGQEFVVEGEPVTAVSVDATAAAGDAS
ncbi:MAG: efflux RND transporter periplasmic adaptor subunit [Alphaproteobacteria bacterium]|nr:efflux RND transporter periplasmic adaptor subunit [Alphaproteobacteria bacterium]